MSVQSVYQQLEFSTQDYAERPFLHIPADALLADSGQSQAFQSAFESTYAEMLSGVNQLKAQYQASGLQVADRVAILLQNKPEFCTSKFGKPRV